jgi:GR25 family glycosyltransferase involved in LPS biosynthesis
MNLDKIYLINLEKRKDRLEHFINECKRENVDMSKIEIFKALDGETYNFSQEEINLFKNSDIINNPKCKNFIGNQLSHFYILEDIIKNDYKKSIIFQDDVRFKHNFLKDLGDVLENIPEDAEIVWIGLHKVGNGSYFEDFPIDEKYDMHYCKEKINDYICKLHLGVNPCSLAYIVTEKGAKNFVEYIRRTKEFRRATDGNFNDYLQQKDIMYCSNIILCTGNSRFKSDIFYDVNMIYSNALDILEELGY